MPVPSTIADLSTTPGSNSPAGSESPNLFDDYLRTAFAFIKQLEGQSVNLTGNQTIAGVKTFSSPIAGSVTGNAGTATKLQTARTIGGVPFDGSANINLPGVNTAGNQNTSGNAATATTDNQHFGIGQSWFDVTTSRASGTTYTNTTTRPIVISARSGVGASGSVAGYVSGNLVVQQTTGGGQILAVQVVVPAGQTYSITSTAAFIGWWELR